MSRRTRGQSLVEFALVLPVLLIILFGIVDFGRMIFAYNAVSNAAREGTRVAIVNQDAAAIEAEALAATTGMDPSHITVTFTPCTGTTAIGCMVKVKVAYQFKAITPIIGELIGTLVDRREVSAEAAMVVERIYSAPPTP